MKYLLVKTTGEVSEPKPAKGQKFTYKELNGFVGGLIQIVPFPRRRGYIVVHEEGKLIGLPVNEKATDIWKTEYPIEEYPDNNDQLIVGDALVAYYGGAKA